MMNIAGDQPIPKESLDDLMPFPTNPQFVSQPVLGEDIKEAIWKRVVVDGTSVRRVSAGLQIDMRRVGAVVRLKAVQKAWEKSVCLTKFTGLQT